MPSLLIPATDKSQSHNRGRSRLSQYSTGSTSCRIRRGLGKPGVLSRGLLAFSLLLHYLKHAKYPHTSFLPPSECCSHVLTEPFIFVRDTDIQATFGRRASSRQTWLQQKHATLRTATTEIHWHKMRPTDGSTHLATMRRRFQCAVPLDLGVMAARTSALKMAYVVLL